MFGSEHRQGGELGSFILNEIRDLRRGMEGRDSELRGEITAVRDAVATLSESVSRSHNNAEAIRGDVEEIARDVRVLRKDVDDMQRGKTIDDIQSKSAWDGPKKIAAVLAAIGGVAVAVVAVLKLLPIVGIPMLMIPAP